MALSSQELDDERRMTVACMNAYAEIGAKKMREAEELMASGLKLRDEAMVLFQQATRLALEYAAMAKDYQAKTVPEDEDAIAW